nr:xanthan lyase [uncultured Bacteroides sp.]
MKPIRVFVLSLLFPVFFSQVTEAQELSKEMRSTIGSYLTQVSKKTISVGPIYIDSFAINKKKLELYANMNCSYIPFREDNVTEIYRYIRQQLPPEFVNYEVVLITDKHPIEELIPLALRSKKDKKAKTFVNDIDKPLITRISVPYRPTKGLLNRHIAMWQSHGYYYESKLTRWEWQRARIFQTVEDLYTQSYVLPFLVPMLENAGANVLLPRERDTNTAEIIIDNDGTLSASSRYIEKITEKKWTDGAGPGFAQKKDFYINNDNPFHDGTFRLIETIKKGKESTAEWIPDIPKVGTYAVYVSYKSVENSTDDALYTVYHKGGTTQFKINQTMGGGTWIYLGHFSFDAGRNYDSRIVLTNKSSMTGKVVTADAIKIGGGFGNIARRIADSGTTENVKSSDTKAQEEIKLLPKVDYPYETSGYPRYTEGARYWLQWAGFPEDVYSPSKGVNDYTDDYKSRGLWVNYLAGGSSVDPKSEGLNIPIDLSFAFHTDAGTTMNDSIIGSLGIFCTNTDDTKYANGVSRYAARDLTDLVQSQIVNDIRSLYEPNWSRRGMWNQSYYEARVPKVPAMLLELLSHQNFADMRYGLDPRFRFTVSRAIYKGILQFVSSQYKQKYVVQPLPIDHFNIHFVNTDEVELNWKPVMDPLEPTAVANKYVVYTRIDDGEFDNGVIVNTNSYRVSQNEGQIYSYKVTALNDGGESFPSEILSASRVTKEKGMVLVVNGFDRISAPADFVADSIAGFYDVLDHGVPYKQDYSYIGSQTEFRRNIPWMDDDAAGFGASRANYEKMVIAGNTFDYPFVHGKAITNAGYSFVSCSDEAVMDKNADLKEYKFVDLILGKERETKMGRGGQCPNEFKTFPDKLQSAIKEYCEADGNIFISGAFVGSDLWDNKVSRQEDRNFAMNTLKYKWRTGQAAITGEVKSVASPFVMLSGNYDYYNELNAESYAVESPDGIEPAAKDSYTVFRYSENNLSAGVAYKGKYKTCILGFPFESVKKEEERSQLMKSVLYFFSKTE